MRYVAGLDVRALIERVGTTAGRRGRSSWSLQVASALDTAHAAGLVHRDVKPANMLLASLNDDGLGADHVYLSDFGLSKQSISSPSLTMTGQFLGTLDYMSPEQVNGRQIDGKTDQYALGCAAFEMLTGQPPFRREANMAVMWAQVSAPPPSVRTARPELSPRVDEVLGQALAKAPEDRYGTCMEFALALREACAAGVWVGRRAGRGRRRAAVTPPVRDPTELVAGGAGAAEPAAGLDGGIEPTVSRAVPGGGYPGGGAGSAGPPTGPAPGGPVHRAGPPAGLAGRWAAAVLAGATERSGLAMAVRAMAVRRAGRAGPGRRPAVSARTARSTGRGWAAVSGQRRRLPGHRPGAAAEARQGSAGPARGSRRAGASRLGGAGAAPAQRRQHQVGPPVKHTVTAAAPPARRTAARRSPITTPKQTPTQRSTLPAGPAGTVVAFFQAINDHDYAKAWNLNTSAHSISDYQQFKQGYAQTSHDTVTITGVSGDTVSINLVADQTDGTTKTFSGSYVVENGAIVQSSIQQTG